MCPQWDPWLMRHMMVQECPVLHMVRPEAVKLIPCWVMVRISEGCIYWPHRMFLKCERTSRMWQYGCLSMKFTAVSFMTYSTKETSFMQGKMLKITLTSLDWLKEKPTLSLRSSMQFSLVPQSELLLKTAQTMTLQDLMPSYNFVYVRIKKSMGKYLSSIWQVVKELLIMLIRLTNRLKLMVRKLTKVYLRLSSALEP